MREKDRANKKGTEKSQIPVVKKTNPRKSKREPHDNQCIVNSDATKEDVKRKESPKPSTSKSVPKPVIAPPQMTIKEKIIVEVNEKEKRTKRKTIKKETVKAVKESTMSLDSLEDALPNSAKDKSRQSIGINTELMCPCIPCVIHDGVDTKVTTKTQFLPDQTTNKNNLVSDKKLPEPKVELLYKNLTMVSSCDIQSMVYRNEPELKEDTSVSNFEHSKKSPSSSNNLTFNHVECKSESYQSKSMESKFTERTEIFHNEENNKEITAINRKSKEDIVCEKTDEEIQRLSAEDYEENYERDMSEFDDSIENHNSEDKLNQQNDVMCRHGSGDTYTKFTEDPADLEEFMNITDKMMTRNDFSKESLEMAKQVNNLHTPQTNSIESINKDDSNKDNSNTDAKHNFSDSLEELKNNLKDLLDGAGDDIKDAFKEDEKDAAKRKVSDMEHITVYELKFYEWKPGDVETPVKEVNDLKLPSIAVNNKPERKGSCNKQKIQKIYKPDRKYKMLGEDKRGGKEYKTFIKEDNDDSDGQSISAEAPPLKLPRIEPKRLDTLFISPFPMSLLTNFVSLNSW